MSVGNQLNSPEANYIDSVPRRQMSSEVNQREVDGLFKMIAQL